MRVEMNCILLTSGKQAQDEMVQFTALIMCINMLLVNCMCGMAYQSISSSEQVSNEGQTSKSRKHESGPNCVEEEEEDALWGSMQTIMEPAKKVGKRAHLPAGNGMRAEHPTYKGCSKL